MGVENSYENSIGAYRGHLSLKGDNSMKKRTKIICTMGPNTDNRDTLVQLAKEGMDIARCNFSHGTHEEQKAKMDMIKSVREELGKPIAILLDTKGPEIRTGLLKEGKVQLVEGETITLTTDMSIEGDASFVAITYKQLPAEVEKGNIILVDDGLIGLEVEETTDTTIVCKIINGGLLGNRKGINVPNVKVNLPAITEQDKKDILFGIEQGIDFIAASFIRNAEGVNEIRAILEENNAGHIGIISKIENQEGVENIMDIIEASDGIMVARGDLGVEIPEQEVPFIQKRIIQKCNEAFKPVITATQMLDSMIRNPRPTRAEVTDVANAIYDGTDAIMLSGETAMGKYPVEALKMMASIADATELHLPVDASHIDKALYHHQGISTSVAMAAVETAMGLNAKCIIIPTMSGFTVKLISKLKPDIDIIALSPDERTRRRVQLYWGVQSLAMDRVEDTDTMMETSVKNVVEAGLAKEDDIIVMTAGGPSRDGFPRLTDTVKVAVVH